MRRQADTPPPQEPQEQVPVQESRPLDAEWSRRQFVTTSAAALAAGVALPSTAAASPPARRLDRSALHRPNLLILITDQERFPQHWPDGWAKENLPGRRRLARHGLTFTRAFCAASMCSPSRATLFTGLYPAHHGVTEVLNLTPVCECAGQMPHYGQGTLQPTTQNMARMLAAAGYNVQYRGKWHISKDRSGTLPPQSPSDLAQYGFHGWLPPDAAEHTPPYFGGGTADNDGLYADQAAAFLEQADPHADQPFALFVCLVNPHDIMGYPKYTSEPSHSDIPPWKGTANYESAMPECFEQGIELPPTHDEPASNYKPAVQAQSTALWTNQLGALEGDASPLKYVNFYAFLHKESDRHIGTVLDALEANPGLYDQTLVFRLSDHGEMGLSHGGMRQKAYNAYEETIHIPLVVSNPRLFPHAARTNSLASTIDLMATFATLADVPNREDYTFLGHDLTPIIEDAIAHPDDPTAEVQDEVLYTTDETIGSVAPTGSEVEPPIKPPFRIRCLRESRWKIVMYFDPSHPESTVYELYDLREDPIEYHNLADPASPRYNQLQLDKMKKRLNRKLIETGTEPR